MTSFSPVLSQASSTMMTPLQQTQQQQQGSDGGFSMFGGKAHSTPVDCISSSGGTRRPPPLSSHTPIGNSAPATSHAETSRGSGGRTIGGGLSRFKTLAQKTLEEEREEDEDESRRWGSDSGGSGRGEYTNRSAAPGVLNTPSSSLLSPTTGIGSLSPELLPFGGGGGGVGRHSVTTPSSLALSSLSSGGAPPTAATSRKRPRAPSTATTSPARPVIMSGALQLTPVVGSGGGGDALVARTWGSMGDGDRGGGGQQRRHHQHQQRQQQNLKATPSPIVRARAAGAGAARGLSGSGSSRSPRPTRSKPPSQSPRGRGKVVGSGSPRLSQPPPLTRRYELADFAGADDVCFNPGEIAFVVFKRLWMMLYYYSNRDDPCVRREWGKHQLSFSRRTGETLHRVNHGVRTSLRSFVSESSQSIVSRLPTLCETPCTGIYPRRLFLPGLICAEYAGTGQTCTQNGFLKKCKDSDTEF